MSNGYSVAEQLVPRSGGLPRDALDDAHMGFTGDPSIIGFDRRAGVQDLDGLGGDDRVVTFAGRPSLLVGSDAWDHMYSLAAMLGME